jgi:formylmethanofuran dehydrogenase subunit C
MERFPLTPDSGTLICDMAIWDWLGTEMAGHELSEPISQETNGF